MFVHLDLKIINILHILVLSTLLGYIGYFKEKANKNVYILLGLWTLMIPIFVPLPEFSKSLFSYWNIIKFSHYIIFLPLLLYLSYYGYKNNFSKNTYTSILFTALFIALYHSYKLYIRLKI